MPVFGGEEIGSRLKRPERGVKTLEAFGWRLNTSDGKGSPADPKQLRDNTCFYNFVMLLHTKRWATRKWCGENAFLMAECLGRRGEGRGRGREPVRKEGEIRLRDRGKGDGVRQDVGA